MTKKIVTRKGLSKKRVFFLIQVIIIFPVLILVLLVNFLTELCLDGWNSYREWYFGSNRKKQLAKA